MASAIVGRSDSKRGAFSKRESEVRRALYSSGIMIWITEGYIVMPSYTITYYSQELDAIVSSYWSRVMRSALA